jgi:hypothetical protein
MKKIFVQVVVPVFESYLRYTISFQAKTMLCCAACLVEFRLGCKDLLPCMAAQLYPPPQINKTSVVVYGS